MSSSDSGATSGSPTEPVPTPAEPTPVEPTPTPAPVPPAAAPATAAVPPTAETLTWPPAGSAPASTAARPPRGAWIRALSPLTAGVLAGLLLLAGFGVGVVVGWQHDGHGDRFGPVGFNQKGRMGPGDGMRGFGPGQGYGRQFGPGQRDQQGQQGGPGQQVQPGQPNLPTRRRRPRPDRDQLTPYQVTDRHAMMARCRSSSARPESATSGRSGPWSSRCPGTGCLSARTR